MEAIGIIVFLLSFAGLMYCWGAFDDMIAHYLEVKRIREGWEDDEQ